MTVLEQLRKTIEDGHPGETEKLVREALKQHIPAGRIVERGHDSGYANSGGELQIQWCGYY